MFDQLIRFIPLSMIGLMVSSKRILNTKECIAQEAFMRKIYSVRSYTILDKIKKPLVVAMIGVVGSGKSSVSREFAKYLKTTIIENDAIRIELRKLGEGYERVWAIAENAAVEIAKLGGSVVLDSDFVDEKKRASLREKVRKTGARLVFVRTHCDFDVMSERIRTNDPGEFFNDAKSLSKASDNGKDVKMRELLRRIPLHYRWLNQGVGKWVLKKFPFAIFAEIDTTDTATWKEEVEKYAKKLIA